MKHLHASLIRRLELHLPHRIRYVSAYLILWLLYAVGSLLARDRAKWQSRFQRLRTETNYVLFLFVKFTPMDGDWHGRVQFDGVEELLELQARGTSVICCFLHVGHYQQNRFLLKAAGIQAKALVADRSHFHSDFATMTEASTFQVDQLKQAYQYLKQGGWLNVAVDVVDSTPFCFALAGGRHVQFSSAAFRMGRRQGACMVGIRVEDLPGSRLRVYLSAPVRISEAADCAELAGQLYRHFQPSLSDSEYCSSTCGRFVLGESFDVRS
jgi:lauroyl/myristoyl acyltransferase